MFCRRRNDRRSRREVAFPGHVDLRPQFENFGLACRARGRAIHARYLRSRPWPTSKAGRTADGPHWAFSEEFAIWAARKATGKTHDQAMFYEATCGLNRFGICRRRPDAVFTERDSEREAVAAGAGRCTDPQSAVAARALDPTVERQSSAERRRVDGDRHAIANHHTRRVRHAVAEIDEGEPKESSLCRGRIMSSTAIASPWSATTMIPASRGVASFASATATGRIGATGVTDSFPTPTCVRTQTIHLAARGASSIRSADRAVRSRRLADHRSRSGRDLGPVDGRMGTGDVEWGQTTVCRGQKNGSVGLRFDVRRPGRYRVTWHVLATAGPD